MSLTTGEMSAADLAAVVGNRNDGFGFGGDGAWWIILLFLCLFNGGFGGGYGNGGNGGMFYPYYLANNTDNGVQAGFNNASVAGQLNGIQGGIQALSTQLCNCCGDMRDVVNNGFSQAEIANNARQMANMNQIYGLSSQFADCCCENRLGIADLKYTVATENCADRAALSDGLRDVIASENSNTQRILDKLCQLELDAKQDTIAQLRSELMYARGQASQDVQTAQILAGQVAEIDGMYNRLSTCPVPSVPVYGRQTIFNPTSSCGCGA